LKTPRALRRIARAEFLKAFGLGWVNETLLVKSRLSGYSYPDQTCERGVPIMFKQLLQTVFLLTVCSAIACAQAAVEYGAVAGTSATTTSGAASAMNRLNQRLTGALQQKTSSAANTTVSPRNPVSTPKAQRVTSEPIASRSTEPIRAEAAVANPQQSTQKPSKYPNTVTLSIDK
jgi:hypothetical protein